MTLSAATPLATPALPLGDEVEAGLFQIVRKHLKVQDVNWTSETTMAEAQIDSLDLVEVVFEIEDHFGIEINFNANTKPADEFTFGDMVGLIRSALASKAQPAEVQAATVQVA